MKSITVHTCLVKWSIHVSLPSCFQNKSATHRLVLMNHRKQNENQKSECQNSFVHVRKSSNPSMPLTLTHLSVSSRKCSCELFSYVL
jgi:hypothetical protein